MSGYRSAPSSICIEVGLAGLDCRLGRGFKLLEKSREGRICDSGVTTAVDQGAQK
jgi:hypothetical protein